MPTVQVTGPSLVNSGQPDGGTIAAIQKLQPAHSRTDIAVLIPAANVLHAGDLIEVGAYPFIDWWAGGSLDGMIEEVDRILPALMGVRPDVVLVTGDHSTPSLLRAHSWHPVPYLLWSNVSMPGWTTGRSRTWSATSQA